MSLIKDVQEGLFERLEGFMKWELFDRVLDVTIDKGVPLEYVEKCAEALNSLSEETIKGIYEAAKRYCLFFIDLCGDAWDYDDYDMQIRVTEDTPAEDMKSEIRPHVFIVDTPKDERIGFHIECGCSWEPEHGLEITILDGKLVYLGGFEDCGAWDKFRPDDEWNFANDLKRTN